MSLIEVDRYADRTDAFDEIISATEDHFWDPTDPRYIDFERRRLRPRRRDDHAARVHGRAERAPSPTSSTSGQKIRLANQSTRFMISSILHGEQGALSLSASLCQILRDPGAQEYAANQTREEARHVTGFARYVAHALGHAAAAGPDAGRT